MTQDCSTSLSTASENHGSDNRRFSNGIHIAEAETSSASGIEGVSVCESPLPLSSPTNSTTVAGGVTRPVTSPHAPLALPWGYIYLHNKRVELFKKQIDAYNLSHPDSAHPCFVHYSYRYKQKSDGRGVTKVRVPSVSGLVFLQGEPSDLQSFLKSNYPQYHLVNDCSTGRAASISHSMMQPFMEAATAHPDNITFLRDPFIKFAKDHTRLRILSGPFKGMEGYIIRIHRDRQLVMEFGGYAVAIRGVHNEDFEVAE
ncbi:MAG: hypothetical protein NC080_01610 [Paraprevotella sp.]|nr:hypothetical protein [Paraprevotella sp.]